MNQPPQTKLNKTNYIIFMKVKHYNGFLYVLQQMFKYLITCIFQSNNKHPKQNGNFKSI